jgi:hypothetical protein
MDAYAQQLALAREFPVTPKLFPDTFKKFPVPLCREFYCKSLNSLTDWTAKSLQSA